MKSVVVLVAPGFEEVEALTPVDYLRRAGAEVIVVAAGTSSRTVEGARKISVVADMTLETYVSSCVELPDAVIAPGGMPGTLNLAKCVQAMAFLKKMHEENKLVCAICAAPAIVFSQAEILHGKKWTCYPGMEEDVAEYKENHVKDVPFVTDGNVVTSRGAGTAEEFSMEIIRILLGQEAAKKIHDATVQR